MIQDNGNVGIGTTTPGQKLTVLGNGAFLGEGSTRGIIVNGYNGQSVNNYQTLLYSQSGAKGVLTLGNNSVNEIRAGNTGAGGFLNFYINNGVDGATVTSNGILAMTLASSGNVGIGTTSPSSPLHIEKDVARILQRNSASNSTAGMFIIGGTQATNYIFLGSANGYSAGGTLTCNNASDFLTLGTAGAEKLRITSTGNVGIGTTTPTQKLDVQGTARFSNASGGGLILQSTSGSSNKNILYWQNVSGTEKWRIVNDQDANLTDDLRFYSNAAGTSVMTMTQGGNVGVGTTTPTAQLHTTGTVRFSNFGAGTLTTDASGNLSVSSDERLKNIDGEFTRGLDDIAKLSPISYHWNTASGLDTSTQYASFSAQNVQAAIPEAVGSSTSGYLTLADRPILAALVNATKEIAAITGEFKSSLIAWLGNADNGITAIFARDSYASNGTFETTSTQKLCISDSANDNAPLCVTKSQLAAILSQSAAANLPPSVIPTTATNSPESLLSPVIELNGNASSTIEIGDNYSDLGARIIAPESDLNLGLVLDGATTTAVSIDTTTPGEHTVFYTVTSPTTGLTGGIMRTVVISPAVAPPVPEEETNPFNAPPSNDNASSTAVVDVAA